MSDEELWQEIEASGPYDSASSLAEPPAGVDPEAWFERALTQADRRRTFLAFYAWAVPNRKAITAIRTFVGARQVLEVCAGTGLWARLLLSAGSRVVATDGVVPRDTDYVAVESLDAEAAVWAHRECEALLLCWPPFRDGCACRALQAFAGDRVVFVGDVRFTGDEQFHLLLEQDWMLAERIPIPSWPGLDDYVYLYRGRRRVAAATRR